MQPTNPQKFTEKAQEAIAKSPDIAKQSNQQQIESEHLMKSLIGQEGLALLEWALIKHHACTSYG